MPANSPDKRLWTESQLLRKILPENVWVQVFSKLEISPDDQQNVCNSTVYFHQMLFSKRKLFLAGKTVDLVVGWMTPAEEEDEFIAILDKIEKFKVHCILNCRAVCLSWCNGLDEQYLKHNSQLFLHKQTHWTTATQFLNHFQSSHFSMSDLSRRRPYALKDLNIFLEIEDFHTELPKLFNINGFRITNLAIRARGNSFPTLKSCYNKLGDMLLKTPNIQNLALTDYLLNDNSLAGGLDQDLKESGHFVFKKLKNLITFQVPDIIFNRIIQTNTQLTAIKFSYQSVGAQSFVSPFPFLKKVEVCEMEISKFRKYAAQLSKSPVEELTIQIHTIGDSTTKWSNVFNSFPRQWSLTVSVLDLSLPKTSQLYFVEQAFQDSLNCRLKLPLVKNLKLSMPHAACLDFLLPMSKSLQRLEISDTNSCEYEKVDDKIKTRLKFRQVVDFVDFGERMYESNIWGYFPKLMKIELDWCTVYHRSIWKRTAFNASIFSSNIFS